MKKHFITLSLALVILATVVGCAAKEAVVKPPVAGSTSTEAEKPAISNAEAQRQIATVQNDKSVPEAAKAGIIAQIKHKAGLQ